MKLTAMDKFDLTMSRTDWIPNRGLGVKFGEHPASGRVFEVPEVGEVVHGTLGGGSKFEGLCLGYATGSSGGPSVHVIGWDGEMIARFPLGWDLSVGGYTSQTLWDGSGARCEFPPQRYSSRLSDAVDTEMAYEVVEYFARGTFQLDAHGMVVFKNVLRDGDTYAVFCVASFGDGGTVYSGKDGIPLLSVRGGDRHFVGYWRYFDAMRYGREAWEAIKKRL